MCIFKEYSNFFGEARTGVHSFRILDAPVVDHFFTILLDSSFKVSFTALISKFKIFG